MAQKGQWIHLGPWILLVSYRQPAVGEHTLLRGPILIRANNRHPYVAWKDIPPPHHLGLYLLKDISVFYIRICWILDIGLEDIGLEYICCPYSSEFSTEVFPTGAALGGCPLERICVIVMIMAYALSPFAIMGLCFIRNSL